MNLASLIPFAPYLTILYVVFAFIQVLRRQHQGIVALILAFLVLAAPIAVYFLSASVTERLSMINAMALSAGIVFVASMIIGMLDRQNKDRRQRTSYGIIGTVMSFVMAIFIVVMPMTQTAAAGFATTGLQPTVSAQIQQVQETAFAKVLAAQTGLTASELTTQLTDGSTITTLVSTHNGDLSAVTTALITALDDLKAQNTMMTQMLSTISSDSKEIATKMVRGELPAQAQRLLITQLISGTMAPPQGNPPTGSGQSFDASGTMAPPQGDPSNGSGQPFGSPSTDTTPMAPLSNNGAMPAATTAARVVLPTNTPMPAATLVPTEVVIRPTLITFPTATPTVEAAMVAQTTTDNSSETISTGGSGVTTSATKVTCTLAVDFNLNLRDKPSTDGSNVLLSIPFGTTVTATGYTADNWYNISYEGKTGWVSGQYTTAQASCSQLAQVTP